MNSEPTIYIADSYSFSVKIREEPFHYSLKIEARDFLGYVELYVDKSESSDIRCSTLVDFYSEPAEWRHLDRVVALLKASFQISKNLFKTTMIYLYDKSNLECGVEGSVYKLEKPILLAYLTIAQEGKTWYEKYLNAFLYDTEKRRDYKVAMRRLRDPESKNMDFHSFAAMHYLTKEQYEALKPLYEQSQTWSDFFQKVFKEKSCLLLLFNWLPDFIEKTILGFKISEYKWCISVDTDFCRIVEPVDPVAEMSTKIQTQTASLQTGVSGETWQEKIIIFSFSNRY